jgi:NAD(P)-dependent dehydrogenase (short-subunit alcohol dehydrogenase family)
VKSLGANASGIVADNRKVADVEAMAAQVKQRFTQLDCLVASVVCGPGLIGQAHKADENASGP